MRAASPVVRWLRSPRFREIFLYLVFGGLTTLVNLAVSALLGRIVGVESWVLYNLPAILAAILFAFLTNRAFVFRSRGPFFQELWKFFASRILVSVLFEYGAMYLLFDLAGFQAVLTLAGYPLAWAKILTQLLVIVGNYILSKLVVFTSSRAGNPSVPPGEPGP